MTFSIRTYTQWDENVWTETEPIYQEAFPHGAKPVHILRNIVESGIGQLHGGYLGDELVAMAVTGITRGIHGTLLIIDYMAVREDLRGSGLGRTFLEMLSTWGNNKCNLQGILIEVEAGDSEEHQERVKFWERCGFILTEYIHQYIWVPEPYQAMVLPLGEKLSIEDGGESLFRYISSFHQQSFRQH
ncbi:GNAT family N-acetyltransferase [Paenibacillus sp. sgz500958]|uniref:GNAT family N-acetyltransferase n=1 Tax=Paenibacillus sp. sgz500958 TaxID=3242475 RepID=UPI0036D30A8E